MMKIQIITFQVMRRSLGTHLLGHGTLKDAQGALRHASITTTGNIYVQVVEENVMRAVNSRWRAGACEGIRRKHYGFALDHEAINEVCDVRPTDGLPIRLTETSNDVVPA